jgi:hypothetical protein
MPIDQISEVEVNATIYGTTLIIKGYGHSEIIIRRMNIQEAYQAQEIINSLRAKIK